MARIIALDGAQGEGGGQILRSALSLSMITGQPFEMSGIRAGRAKPAATPAFNGGASGNGNLRRAGERRRAGLATVAFYAGADSRRRVPFCDWQRGQLYAGAANRPARAVVC